MAASMNIYMNAIQENMNLKAMNETLNKQLKQVTGELSTIRRDVTELVEALNKRHAIEIAEMEKKMESVVLVAAAAEAEKSQLDAKYMNIMNGFRKKIDTERQNQSMCAMCEKPIEQKRVCSAQCEKLQ